MQLYSVSASNITFDQISTHTLYYKLNEIFLVVNSSLTFDFQPFYVNWRTFIFNRNLLCLCKTVEILISLLYQEQADLDLHCFQKKVYLLMQFLLSI